MAAKKKSIKKKSVKTRTPGQREALKTVRKHRRAAQSRVGELREKHVAGTLTQEELNVGLEELDKHLEQMADYEFDI